MIFFNLKIKDTIIQQTTNNKQQTTTTTKKKRIVVEEDYYGQFRECPLKLSLFEGLESLPLELRDKTATEIAQYILDLTASAVSLYRTKLMVVGYEKVGKTSLLECLFPFKIQNVLFNSKSASLDVTGKELRIYDKNALFLSKAIHLEQGKWKVIEEKPNKIQIKRDNPQEQYLFEVPSQEERQGILKRIQRITGDTRTHGNRNTNTRNSHSKQERKT